MQVIKRDASLEDFNKQKIVIAIISAMEEGNGIKEDIAQKIADEIEEKYSKSSDFGTFKNRDFGVNPKMNPRTI